MPSSATGFLIQWLERRFSTPRDLNFEVLGANKWALIPFIPHFYVRPRSLPPYNLYSNFFYHLSHHRIALHATGSLPKMHGHALRKAHHQTDSALAQTVANPLCL